MKISVYTKGLRTVKVNIFAVDYPMIDNYIKLGIITEKDLFLEGNEIKSLMYNFGKLNKFTTRFDNDFKDYLKDFLSFKNIAK